MKNFESIVSFCGNQSLNLATDEFKYILQKWFLKILLKKLTQGKVVNFYRVFWSVKFLKTERFQRFTENLCFHIETVH